MQSFFKQKRTKRTNEEANLVKWHSRYVRLRDTVDGVCQCITCPKSGHPKDFDCGHFVTRDKYNLKYHEKNAHAQCTACNMYGKGEQAAHAAALDRKYGFGTADTLRALGTRSGRLKGYAAAALAAEFKIKTYIELGRSNCQKWW